MKLQPCFNNAESIFDSLTVDPSELDRSYTIGSGAQKVAQPTIKVSDASNKCLGYLILPYNYSEDVIYFDNALGQFYIDTKDQNKVGTTKFVSF